MNEQQFGNSVRQTLNQGIAISPAVRARLRASREFAVEKQKVTETSTLLSWAGNVGGLAPRPRSLLSTFLLPALILAIGLFAVSSWYRTQQAEETVEIDTAVLTGDLPIDAYLDKGFGAWLRYSSD
jgi:hypothetical protein